MIEKNTLERWRIEAEGARAGIKGGMPAGEIARIALQLIAEVERLSAPIGPAFAPEARRGDSRDQIPEPRKVYGGLLAPDDPPLSDTNVEALRVLDDPTLARVLDALDIACAELAAFRAKAAREKRKTEPQPPERCPACLSTESAAVHVQTEVGLTPDGRMTSLSACFGSISHVGDCTQRLGSAPRACTTCGCIYFPIRKGA